MRPLAVEPLADFGTVYGPPTGDGLPGVVVLHGSEGPMAGWTHRFSVILAMHGFLALPLGYGKGDFWRAGPIRDVPLKRTLDAIEALCQHSRCTNAGLFGWSRGGEHTVLLASLVEDPARLPCIAAHAPSNHVVAAFDPDSVGGRQGSDARSEKDIPRAWNWPEHDARLAPGNPIEIERYRGPVFLSVGTADEIWDHNMTLDLAERLTAAGNPPDLLVAEGQGHALDFGFEPILWDRLTTFLRNHLT